MKSFAYDLRVGCRTGGKRAHKFGKGRGYGRARRYPYSGVAGGGGESEIVSIASNIVLADTIVKG